MGFHLRIIILLILFLNLTVRSEEKLLCEDGSSLLMYYIDGQLHGRLGEKDGGGCYFTGIEISKQFGDIEKSTLDELIFFSGFHDHCSSGRILIYNGRNQTIVEVNTWEKIKTKTYSCKLK